jgi:hypothetical protein
MTPTDLLRAMVFSLTVGGGAAVLTVLLLDLAALYGVTVWMLFFAGGAASAGYLHRRLNRPPTLRE